MRDAAGEFDHLQAPLDVTLGVSNHLAVFRREQFCKALHLALHQPLKLKHHPRPALGIGGGPGGLGAQSSLNGEVQLSRGGQGDPGLDKTRIRIKHLAIAAGGSRDGHAVDEMCDVAHGGS